MNIIRQHVDHTQSLLRQDDPLMLRRDESFSQFLGQAGCVPHDRTYLLAENTLEVMTFDGNSNCEC
jgi:hypothetical protein